MSLIDLADDIIEQHIPDVNQTGIVPIHPEIFVKHRSVNLFLGKPGSSKTTSIIKELIKISTLKDPHFHLVVWVNKTGDDQTLDRLETFIRLPILRLTYDEYKEWYPKFVDDKKHNNRLKYETIIVLDDVLGEIKNEKSEIAQSLSICRHINCIVILVGQQAVGSIPTKLTSLLNTVWIFKGYTRNNISTIRQNTAIPFDLDTLWHYYTRLRDYQKIICDNDEQGVITV
ncbi:Uncharacterized protein QTN25_010657 [Entamoeba marina]